MQEHKHSTQDNIFPLAWLPVDAGTDTSVVNVLYNDTRELATHTKLSLQASLVESEAFLLHHLLQILFQSSTIEGLFMVRRKAKLRIVRIN